jgi:signal transduction histidine kinase
MDALQALVAIYRSNDPAAAIRALVDGLSSDLPVHCAVWISADETTPLCSFPSEIELPPELLSIASHLNRPEVFPLETLSPVGAAQFPDSEMLVLPLSGPSAQSGAIVMVAADGTFGESALAEEWREITDALEAVEERNRQLTEAQGECTELRKRTREMEALDVLGLAVNRTLDAGEVLTLVARFTRTLLGAHYAIVYTKEEDRIEGVAAIGIGGGVGEADDDPFARKVMEVGKPVILGAGGEPFDSGAFPLHASQRMTVGLGVPLSLFGQTFGALVVGYRDEYPVTSRDSLLALTLARHAAVAITNSRLHTELEERSVELADRSDELEVAYRDLHELSQLKERFFTSISHELRTPLNGILGYQNLLLEGVAGEFPEAARTYVQKANRAALTLLQLIGEILDYGKLESGKLELVMRPADLREMVDEAVTIVEPLITQKKLVFNGPSTAAVRPVVTDPDRVRQILVNLLSNAIKFTGEGGEVRVEAAEIDAGPDSAEWVEIRVRDNGPGIKPEDRETIFREFEQVTGTRGGTGLGLPISRKLARLLNGDLVVDSEVGQGSTFILRLPRQEQPATDGMSSNAA